MLGVHSAISLLPLDLAARVVVESLDSWWHYFRMALESVSDRADQIAYRPEWRKRQILSDRPFPIHQLEPVVIPSLVQRGFNLVCDCVKFRQFGLCHRCNRC